MKVRIKGNSLRYRLSMTDVTRFRRDGYIEEVIDFGKTQLTYALQRGAVLSLEAEFMNDKIVVLCLTAGATNGLRLTVSASSKKASFIC